MCGCSGGEWPSTGGLLAEGDEFRPFSTEVASQWWLEIAGIASYFWPLFARKSCLGRWDQR